MRHALIGPILLAALGACAAEETLSSIVPAAEVIISEPAFVANGAKITQADLIARLRSADVVVLGEVHDNPQHHAIQASLVEALAPSGLAVEMIPRASEEGIAVFLDQGGDYGEIGPAIGWTKLGWPDWALYRPVFEAAEGAVITGGALSRRRIRQALDDGAEAAAAAAADPVLIRALADGLPDRAQQAMVKDMIVAHCNKLPASAARTMVEAQRLRDASFAGAALRARQAAGPVVLITGTGHARADRGVPLYLERLAPDLKVMTVGFLESDLAAVTAGADQPFDAVVVTLPAPREDPCLAFQ
ncbi:MAG: ChaN family lipoprotein [Pseudomonadota bacterium]